MRKVIFSNDSFTRIKYQFVIIWTIVIQQRNGDNMNKSILIYPNK